MDTIQTIRRANLLLLLRECGEGRGAPAKLAELTGVKAPYISQLVNRRAHSSGATRRIGDVTARKLERGMGKSSGWMDHPHETTRDAAEREFLRTFRVLTDEQREKLLDLAEMLAKSNRSPDDGADDQATAH